MKKNRTMRAASLLLALTLITSTFVGGTFAKYTTSTTVEDSARVAYWGFTQTQPTTFELFNPEDAGIKDNGRVTVTGTSKYGLLAPGSSDSEDFTFQYVDYNDTTATAPEVDYTFVITLTESGFEEAGIDVDMLDKNQSFTWTLKKNGVANGVYQTFEELKAAVEALDGDAAKYEAGTLPAAFYGNSTDADDTTGDNVKYTIGWNWAFEGTTKYNASYAVDPSGTITQDQFDTAMGNAVVGGSLDDLKLNLTITATQVTE